MKPGKTLLLLLTALIVALGSCKKKKQDNSNSPGNVNIQFVPLYNGQNMALNTNYSDSGGRTLMFSALHFYLSHITLISSDNSTTEVDTLALVDFAFPGTLTYSFNNLKGDYKDIMFGCGVDSFHNTTNPDSVPKSNLLNGIYSMYWSMLRYRFEVFEGKWDTNGGVPFLENPLVYHVGGNSFYRKTQLNYSFSVCCDNPTNLTIYIDVHKFFYAPAETINIPTEDFTGSSTDSTQELLIAKKFADNFSNSFSLQ